MLTKKRRSVACIKTRQSCINMRMLSTAGVAHRGDFAIRARSRASTCQASRQLTRSPKAVERIDRERRPNERKTDQARSCERLVKNEDRDQQLQRRSKVLQQSDSRVRNAARTVRKEH